MRTPSAGYFVILHSQAISFIFCVPYWLIVMRSWPCDIAVHAKSLFMVYWLYVPLLESSLSIYLSHTMVEFMVWWYHHGSSAQSSAQGVSGECFNTLVFGAVTGGTGGEFCAWNLVVPVFLSLFTCENIWNFHAKYALVPLFFEQNHIEWVEQFSAHIESPIYVYTKYCLYARNKVWRKKAKLVS